MPRQEFVCRPKCETLCHETAIEQTNMPDDVRATVSLEELLTRTKSSGRLNGRPKSEGGIESKYLLSGFLVCATCGGRMMITKRTSKRGRPVSYYVCSTHRSRAHACPV